MRPNRSKLLLCAVATLFIARGASAADCVRRISSGGPKSRTVVVAGGDAWSLFRQFLAEIEQKDLDVSLWKVEVQLARGGRAESHTLGWAKQFSGESAERLWERELRNIRAEVNQQLLSDAESAKWDLICVGPAAVPPPPPPPRPSVNTTTTTGNATVPSPPSHNVLVFYKSGMQFAARGDYANAVKEFHAAEKLSPKLEGLQMDLGAAYLQLQDYVSAAKHLSRAIEDSPKHAAAYYNMGCLYARMGQPAKAVASLAAARSHGLELTPAMRRDADLASLRGRSDFEQLFR